ncbi:hypothetical protein MKX08_008388 [Trichoderma sp. CBMAI-0020]|nr:hypothetical protein MKX08_008388 [Trichoderma sp. CBMAI-0020]
MPARTRKRKASEEDIKNVEERESRTVFEDQNILKEWTIEGYVRSVTNMPVKLDLTLIMQVKIRIL